MVDSRRAQPHVFLAVPHGAAARCLLRTDILSTLRGSGARIVALVPNPDEPYLRQELEAKDVAIEELRAPAAPSGRLQTTFVYLRQSFLGRADAVATLRSRCENSRRALSRSNPLVARVLELPLFLLRRSRHLRRGLLALEEAMDRSSAHADLFRRYEPALVVTTSPGWFLADAILLREAARAGVRTASLVVGWDNPTSKGYRGASPDVVVAWSAEMARQLTEHHDLQRDRMVALGAPHFDLYARPAELPARSEVFEAMGLDPARRLVVFACRSPSTYSHSITVAAVLGRALDEGVFGEAQLVVRPHPINFRSDHRRPLVEYGQLSEHHDHVTIDIPAVSSERLSCDVPDAEFRRLAGLLAHCDVLVNAFSTTTLEAFLLDKPVVLVSDEAHRAAGLTDSSAESRPFHLDTHMEPVVASGAAPVATTFEELVGHVADCLKDDSRNAEARRSVAEAECGPNDGRRAEEIASYLVEHGLMGAGARRASAPPAQPARAVL